MTMFHWRLLLTFLLALAVALPLALPLAWPMATLSPLDAVDFSRLVGLARNTGLLVAGTLAVSLPVGVLLAVLLERTDLAGKQVLWTLVLVPLFIPLPLFVSGWQTVLG